MTLADLRKLTPREIARMTDAETRRAYSALRSGVMKQLKRLEGAGYSRPLTSADIPKVSQIPAADMRQMLADVAQLSRDPQYSISQINKRIKATKKWMQQHGFKNVTDKTARDFGSFMGKVRESGITTTAKHKRYESAIDAARDVSNNQGNIKDLQDMFSEYSELQSAGVNMSGFENGEIYGIPLTEAVRHKKALAKYSAELEALANDPDFKKPRTSKDVDNLLRRARRKSH